MGRVGARDVDDGRCGLMRQYWRDNLPPGVTEADIARAAGEDRADVSIGRCACGCGEDVVDGYVYCRDSYGNVFVDESHVLRFHEVEVVGL